jgi:hypothetical protein
VQDVPTAVTPQVGNDPVPLPTSTPQQTGVEPLQSSGPSQRSWSAIGHDAGATHANAVVWLPGIAQQTCSSGHAGFPPHEKS